LRNACCHLFSNFERTWLWLEGLGLVSFSISQTVMYQKCHFVVYNLKNCERQKCVGRLSKFQRFFKISFCVIFSLLRKMLRVYYVTFTITLQKLHFAKCNTFSAFDRSLHGSVRVRVQWFSIKQIARNSGSFAWRGVSCTCTALPSCDCMQQSRGGGVASDAPGRASRGEWG